MATKLKGTDLAYIAAHLETFYPQYRTQIYFCFDSKETGEKAFDILKRVYSEECNYDHYGIDKRDFYLGFTSSTVRNNINYEIYNSIKEYKKVNPEDIEYVPLSDIEPDTGAGLGSLAKYNSTTYIIIGAAAIILILLLWDNKKK